MDHIEIETIADGYTKYWDAKYKADKDGVVLEVDKSEYEWANDKVMDLTFEEPNKLWDIILAVLAKKPSNSVLEILAAGPLEDYLAKLGESVIDRVEEQAKRDPAFASLLGGVWQNEMPEHIWERVRLVWDRSGWDGNA